jgi:hypothetical protein
MVPLLHLEFQSSEIEPVVHYTLVVDTLVVAAADTWVAVVVDTSLDPVAVALAVVPVLLPLVAVPVVVELVAVLA